MTVLSVGNIVVGNVGVGLDMTLIGGGPYPYTVPLATGSQIVVSFFDGLDRQVYGGSFTYTPAGDLAGGTVNQMQEYVDNVLAVNVTGFSVPALVIANAIDTGNSLPAYQAIFGGADIFNGGVYDDKLTSFDGADTVNGGGGNDVLYGGGGNDQLDGGTGTDIAAYEGVSRNYGWSRNPNGSWTVSDYRTGRPEGVDTLANMETLQFSDRTATLSTSANQALEVAFDHILRFAPAGADSGYVGDLAARVNGGTLTQAAAISQIAARASNTTSVATLAYQFFVGSTPSGEGLDYLVAPTGGNPNNLNSAYYQSFNLENRYINFAVNLGKLGAGQASFTASYGGKSLLDTMKSAYLTIFGSTPSDDKAHALLDPRADYFAYYGQDGLNGIGAKAALVGWLLAEAAKANTGSMQTANLAYLNDLADGAPYSLSLVGSYNGTPYFG